MRHPDGLKGLLIYSAKRLEAVVLDGTARTTHGGGPPPPVGLRRIVRMDRQALHAVPVARHGTGDSA